MISNEIILGILWIGEVNKKRQEIGDRRRGRDERGETGYGIWETGERGIEGKEKGPIRG